MPLIYYPDFDEFNIRNETELQSMARRRESNEIPAGDIRQEFYSDKTVRRDFSKLEYRGPGQLASWCHQRMQYISRGLLRSVHGRETKPGHPKRPVRLPDTHRDDSGSGIREVASRNVDPAIAVATAELEDKLRKKIASLPEEQRMILLRKHFDGKSFEELAKLSGLSICTVKTLLQSAHSALQHELPDLF